MIAEAVDTFHAVLWALAGWVIFAGVARRLASLAAWLAAWTLAGLPSTAMRIRMDDSGSGGTGSSMASAVAGCQ